MSTSMTELAGRVGTLEREAARQAAEARTSWRIKWVAATTAVLSALATFGSVRSQGFANETLLHANQAVLYREWSRMPGLGPAVARPPSSSLPIATLPRTVITQSFREPSGKLHLRRAGRSAGVPWASMRITDLSITLHRWDVPRTTYRETFGGGSTDVGVVSIQTDEDVVGHSFLGSASAGADQFTGQVLQRLKPLVMGRNPLDIGAIWIDLWRTVRNVDARSICAVDVALWDIAGKVANLPVHRLLGSYRESVRAYASSAVMSRVRDYVEEAQRFRESGWAAYKIHPHGKPKKDLEICAAVKDAVGDSMVLMLDSMWSYSYEDALRVGLAIQEMGYYWYEDPLAEDDLYGYTKLRPQLRIPILATEYSPSGMYGYTEWIRQQATDMLRGDVALKGGITPMIKIAHLAETFRMKCEIHHGGNSLNNVANLHVTMAVPNCEYFEVLQPDAAQKHGLVKDIEVDHAGLVHAPTSPGLGYEIDWELVTRNKVAELR